MTRRAIFLLLCIVVAAACNRDVAVPRVTQPSVEPDVAHLDPDNLLNLTWGAAVVSRTAELHLEASAVQAIDGIPLTSWAAPPGGANQTFVFSLGAPSRIDRLGLTTFDKPELVPAKVRFEASADGKSWREVLLFEPRAVGPPQLVDVPPFDARFLRVSTLETNAWSTRLRTVHASGSEIALPPPPRFGGCWEINGRAARLVQSGSRLSGIVHTDPPTLVEGGIEGRVARLMWTRGPAWGYLALTLTPDGERISGLDFYEEISIHHATTGWFGARESGCDGLPRGFSAADALLRHAGRWTMYGLTFDERDRLIDLSSGPTLDAAAALIASAPSQRFRVIAREFREPKPGEELKRAKRRISALRTALEARGVDVSRVDFVAAGSEWGEPPIVVALQRLLASRVDLELVR